MESLFWNALNETFKNNPFLLVIVALISYFLFKGVPYIYRWQTGKFKADFEAEEHTRNTVIGIKEDVTEIKETITKLDDSIQKHHADEDSHFKKSEFFRIRNEDNTKFEKRFDSIEKLNVRILEKVLEMNKKPRPVKNTTQGL